MPRHAAAFILIGVCLGTGPAAGLTPADRVVPLWSSWESNSPALTLNWTGAGQPVSYRIERKPLLAPGWTTLAVLTNPAATAFTDTNALDGTAFEYKVTRQDAVTNAWGFLYAGRDLPAVEERGVLILAVESNAAARLAPELTRLELDLAGDGWQTVRLEAPRRNWNDPDWKHAVTNLKARIAAAYAADPARVRAVLLFGHVAVPYSGDAAPDGHPNHEGAWPADAYYGDMDGAWTDAITTTNNGPRLFNAPGDGKTDPTYFDEFEAELMVGRIDLQDMPAFAQPEIELLRQYLSKNHRYRTGRIDMPARGLVRDGFGFFYGEAFAQNGLRDFGTFYGPSNVDAAAFFPTLRTNRYQSVYGCGNGNNTGAAGVGSTLDFATGQVHTVFTMLLGSYFGDWDMTNNFLRAPLASTPSALTCIWAGRPKWFSHPMDLGEPIGTVFRMLQGLGYLDYEEELPISGIHAALMGDPTLRLRYPPPPRSLTATGNASEVVLAWSPPAGAGIAGYTIARADAGSTAFSNLHAGLVSAPVYTDTVSRAGTVLYRVRSVNRETVRSGSYTNLSQGAFIRVAPDGSANHPPAATNMNVATVVNQPVMIPLSGQDPDGDPVFTAVAEWPASGTLTGAPSRLIFAPATGFTGTLHFAYESSDGVADSPTATVAITVAPLSTSRGTSCAWLIRSIGYTNDYENAEEEDHDRDGLPTWAEYRAGTDPLDPRSCFAILDVRHAGSSNRLTWYATTNSGVTSPCAVSRGTSLTVQPWPLVASNLPRHSSGTNSWWDTNTGARFYYRVLTF